VELVGGARAAGADHAAARDAAAESSEAAVAKHTRARRQADRACTCQSSDARVSADRRGCTSWGLQRGMYASACTSSAALTQAGSSVILRSAPTSLTRAQVLTQAEKVPAGYETSETLRPKVVLQQALQGLEQVGDTILPRIVYAPALEGALAAALQEWDHPDAEQQPARFLLRL
jgi:hypothetical protein